MRAILLAVLATACSKADDGKAAPKAVEGAGARDAIVAAWKTGGLTPSPMTAASVGFGKDCQSGTVNNIDVMVCVYPTAAEAQAAREPGLGWVGEATGTSITSGSAMIAIADRRKADASGRTINQLMKLAPK